MAYRLSAAYRQEFAGNRKNYCFRGGVESQGATSKPAGQIALFVLGLPTARPIANIADCWFGIRMKRK